MFIPRLHARNACYLAALAVAAGLIAALIMEHGFGLLPCELCLWQRLPHALTLVTLLVTLGLHRYTGTDKVIRVGLALSALLMFLNTGLAIYHAGVEWQWWQGPTACSGNHANLQDFDAFLAGLDKAKAIACNEAAARFFGLSIAGWNALFCAALFAWCSFFALKSQGSSSTSQ